MVPGPCESHRNTAHVVSPVALGCSGFVVQIKLARFVEGFRIHLQLAIGSGANCHTRGEPNRGRHHESIVVVRVLADYVHPAGSAEDTRLATITSFENGLESVWLVHA